MNRVFSGEIGFASRQNASPTLCFPGETKGCAAAKGKPLKPEQGRKLRAQEAGHPRCRSAYYARIQILFIDDFAISRYSEDGIKILYHCTIQEYASPN